VAGDEAQRESDPAAPGQMWGPTLVDDGPPEAVRELVSKMVRGETDADAAVLAELERKLSNPPPPHPKSPSAPPPPDKQRDKGFFARDDERRWLDRYELICEIAKGGMATVFLGRLVGAGGFQRLVAIKRLHGHLADDPDHVRMFLEEARIAAQIHHAHAVPILEIGQSERGHYLVMEYVEGVTLAQIAARVGASGLPVPHRVALRAVLDALAGLHAAHEIAGPDGKPLGVVHRDCSPHNILVGVDGNARITDFGVARDGSRLSHTRIGTLKGKIAYMAPEQIQQDARLDRRADVYAMGIVLWELLAGRPLFKPDTPAQALVRALHAPVPRLSEVVYGVPPALEAICEKALARDPADRYQTAIELAEAIENAGVRLANAREVATFVLNLFGRELNERRAQIRAWLEEPGDTPDEPVTARDAPHARKPADPSSEPTSAPSSTPPSTIPKQFVGSLDPIPFEPVPPDEPFELPITGPSRSSRLVIAGAAAALIAAGIAAYAMRTPAGAKPAPAATASAAPVAPSPPRAASASEPAPPPPVPEPATAAPPPARAPGSATPPAASSSGKNPADDMANPYR
jgi:serine/threonine-protein kinase